MFLSKEYSKTKINKQQQEKQKQTKKIGLPSSTYLLHHYLKAPTGVQNKTQKLYIHLLKGQWVTVFFYLKNKDVPVF